MHSTFNYNMFHNLFKYYLNYEEQLMKNLIWCHTLSLYKAWHDPVVYLMNYQASPTDNPLNILQGILNLFLSLFTVVSTFDRF